jgi:hypothetical protein
VSTAVGVLAPTIKVAGSPLAATWLNEVVSVRVQRALGLVGRATLRFTDPGYSLSATDTFALGKQVVIADPANGDLIDGTVTGVNLEQSASAHPELTVVVDDDAYKLTRGTRVATYLNASYSDVIRQVAQRNGLQVQVDSTTDVHEYLLQAGSDIEFLNGMVERAGLCWRVDGNTLVVTKIEPSGAVLTLTLGTTLTEFSVRA